MTTPRSLRLAGKRQQALNPTSREAALAALGGTCRHCGERNPDVLQLDHVRGGGNQERAQPGYTRAKFHRSIIAGRTDIQLLCANCHAKKTLRDRVGPRQLETGSGKGLQLMSMFHSGPTCSSCRRNEAERSRRWGGTRTMHRDFAGAIDPFTGAGVPLRPS